MQITADLKLTERLLFALDVATVFVFSERLTHLNPFAE